MKISFPQIVRPFKIFSLAFVGITLLFSACKKVDDFLQPREVDVVMLTDGLISPIAVMEVPDNSTRLAILDQAGQILMMDKHGNRSSVPFLDIRSKMVPLNPNYDERGLLGLAFHPTYKSNGRFFIHYQLPPRPGGPTPTTTWNNLSRVSEFKVSAANPLLADMNSEKVILEWDDPQSNHNGGTIEFGADGMLYIAIGDGGGANDVGPGHVEDWYPVNAGGNAQNIEANFFGKILRIDVNRGTPYSIPNDNPFVNKPGRDEIWAYGLRNPFRFSFDMGGSHALYAGDAGQVLYEEIDVVKKGGNYGWNVKEGTHCFNAANNRVELGSCPSVDIFGIPLTDPVIEMNNYQNPKGGRATTIIGGHVYRGHTLRHLYGKYVFGTFSQRAGTPNGELFMASPGGSGLWSFEELTLKSRPEDLGHYLKGFGQDLKGEIFLTVTDVAGPSGTTGKIYKLVAAEPMKK
jgi:glucose/arabinose dehydrogenase